MRIDQLRREFDLDIRWTVFPLHPETPEEGMLLEDLFAGRIDVPAMLHRLRGVAAELQLPFGDRTRTFNSRRAQELGKWAAESGKEEAFHTAVYQAYFAEGKNLAQPDILAGIASSIGLDGDVALQVLSEGRCSDAVASDWQRAADLGISSVPTIVCDDRLLVGFQPYESYAEFMTR